MSRIWWLLADLLSRMLARGERETVLGDLAECGAGGGESLRGVLGLIARRQGTIWIDWRPWVALMGLIVPCSMALSLHSRLAADGSAITLWMYVNNWDWGFLGMTAFRHGLPLFLWQVLSSFLQLVCWSWIGGFAIGGLSRRTIPLNGALFCLMLSVGEFAGVPWLQSYFPNVLNGRYLQPNNAVFEVSFYRVVFPLFVQVALVLLPALWGMRQGAKLSGFSRVGQVTLWAAAILGLAAIALRSSVWWELFTNWRIPAAVFASSQLHLLDLMVYWPVAYWIATAMRPLKEKNI